MYGGRLRAFSGSAGGGGSTIAGVGSGMNLAETNFTFGTPDLATWKALYTAGWLADLAARGCASVRLPYDPTAYLTAIAASDSATITAQEAVMTGAIDWVLANCVSGGVKTRVLLDCHVRTSGAYSCAAISTDWMAPLGAKYVTFQTAMSRIGTLLLPYSASLVEFQIWNEEPTGALPATSDWEAMMNDAGGEFRSTNTATILNISGYDPTDGYSTITSLVAVNPNNFSGIEPVKMCFTPYQQTYTHQGLGASSALVGYIGGDPAVAAGAQPNYFPPIYSDKAAGWLASRTLMVGAYADQTTFTGTFNATTNLFDKGSALPASLIAGAVVTFTTTGTLPPEITSAQPYIVYNKVGTTFQLSLNVNSPSAIDLTGAGSGTITCHVCAVETATVAGYLENAIQNGDSGHAQDQTYMVAQQARVTDWASSNSWPMSKVRMTEWGENRYVGNNGPGPNAGTYALTSMWANWANAQSIDCAWWDALLTPFQASATSGTDNTLDDRLLISLRMNPNTRVYNSATNAILAKLTSPSYRTGDAIYKFMTLLSDASILDGNHLKSLYIKVANAEADCYIDWINPATAGNTQNVHAGGSMTFTQWGGLKSNGGANDYLEAPSNSLDGYMTRTSAFIAAYMLSSVANGTFGLTVAGSSGGNAFINVASDYFVPMLGEFNFVGISPQAYNWRTGKGLGVGDRSASTGIAVYQNGALTGTTTDASDASPTFGYVQEYVWSSTVAPSTINCAATAYGKGGWTAKQHAIFYSALDALLRELGAPL